MASATFYLLDEKCELDTQQQILDKTLSLIQSQVAAGQRLYIFAADRQMAFDVDEILWQLPPEQFVPHNLSGEGGRSITAVEIGWPGIRHTGYRNILINLAQDVANFAPSFAQVIDFVPCDEGLKQQARDRYKAYRNQGMQLTILAIGDTP
ncbi:DNA polymerase III subunit chi [Parasalinivibrio latis]|uniref:DNA polymerase III subunit chi n=1 Tax=Parasalinivibrio latis TaxID=2952610 RepID=UPI0030E4EF76